MARLSSGVFGSFKSAAYSARPSLVVMRCEKRLGSNVGYEASAKISPLFGSIEMTTPSCVEEFFSCSSAARWRSRSIVVPRSRPGVGVDLFEAAETHDVAGFETFIFGHLLLELIGTDLADVTQHVSQQTIVGIAALRLLLNAQFGVFEVMRLNPRNVARCGALLHLDRLKRGHRLHHFEIIAQDVLVDVESFGEGLDE